MIFHLLFNLLVLFKIANILPLIPHNVYTITEEESNIWKMGFCLELSGI